MDWVRLGLRNAPLIRSKETRRQQENMHKHKYRRKRMTRMTKRDLTDKQLLCIDLLIKKDVTVGRKKQTQNPFQTLSSRAFKGVQT